MPIQSAFSGSLISKRGAYYARKFMKATQNRNIFVIFLSL